jgi:hypothetical protein
VDAADLLETLDVALLGACRVLGATGEVGAVGVDRLDVQHDLHDDRLVLGRQADRAGHEVDTLHDRVGLLDDRTPDDVLDPDRDGSGLAQEADQGHADLLGQLHGQAGGRAHGGDQGHAGHGRNAVLGDTLASLLEWTGYDVTREYYFNDAGRQMRVLGESVRARYLELCRRDMVTSRPEAGTAIVDVGQKAIGSDAGLPVAEEIPGASVVSLSAEHGRLRLPEDADARITLGDKLWLTPWDMGTCVNLYDYIHAVRDGKLEVVWDVAARGRYR